MNRFVKNLAKSYQGGRGGGRGEEVGEGIIVFELVQVDIQ